MTNEERVMTLFEQANPVPEPERVPPTTASHYLDDLHRRSSTMTFFTATDNDPTDAGATQHQEPRGGSNPKRQWLLVAAVIAVLGLVAGLVFVGNRADEEDPVPADEPEPTVPAVEPEPAAEAQALPFAGAEPDQGRYETDLLGTTVTFEVPEDMKLWGATANRVFLDSTFTADTPVTTRALSLNRISGWNSRDEADDGSYLGDGSIDPYDVEAWIEANDVIAGELTATRVAGRQTTVVDVQLEPGAGSERVECVNDQRCVWAASISEKTTGGRGFAEPRLSTGQISRFWVITIEGADPLLVHAAAGVDDEAWLRTVAETTIATLELGPDAPPAGAD